MTTVWVPPAASEFEPYFGDYISLVSEPDTLAAQEAQIGEFREVLGPATPDQLACLHAPYTWTIKQVVAHMLDNERVFGYRALRFSVGDETDLPGYDQDQYTAERRELAVGMSELTAEFVATRHSNLMLFRRMSPHCADRSGLADGRRISVRAIAALQVGHLRHHLEIIKKRLAH